MVHGQQLISSADEGCCVQSKISGMKLILSLNKDESINKTLPFIENNGLKIIDAM